jgi:hypothetical protein
LFCGLRPVCKGSCGGVEIEITKRDTRFKELAILKKEKERKKSRNNF